MFPIRYGSHKGTPLPKEDGALAERALIPVLPSEEEFPYAIRTVSETFESNGSTSQFH